MGLQYDADVVEYPPDFVDGDGFAVVARLELAGVGLAAAFGLPVVWAGLAADEHVERGDEPVALLELGLVEDLARLVGGHDRSAGGGDERLELRDGVAAQLGVAVEFEVEALVVGLQPVAQAQVQRLFQCDDVRVEIGAVHHLLERAEVAEVAFADADDLSRHAVRVGHVDLDLVAGVEIVDVDGFESR